MSHNFKVGQEYTHKYWKEYTCRIVEIKDNLIRAEWCFKIPLSIPKYFKLTPWNRGILEDYYNLTKEAEMPVEKKFEVGKKYKHSSGKIFLCAAVNGNQVWLINENNEGATYNQNLIDYCKEYVPPPKVVKKTGWVRVYTDSTRIKQPNVVNDACSLVFDTEDHAKNSHVKSTRPFFVTKIEWDEIVEDGDDDTI